MLAVSSQQSGLQVHLCAWCGCTMQNGFPVEFSGDRSTLDSHGICHACVEKYFGAALSEADSSAAVVETIEIGGVTVV